MTLLFMDGFDHYGNGHLPRKWAGAGSRTNGSMTTGRFAGQAFRSGDSSNLLVSPAFTNSQTVVLGFAVRFNSLPSVAVINMFLLRDAGTSQMEVRAHNTGQISVARNGTQIAVSTNTMLAASWYYIEFKVTIDNSAGTYEVRVDGVNWLSATGVDTQNTANAYVNQAVLMTGVSTSIDWDDVYVLNSSGSVNNDFLGDVRIDTIYPSAAGNTTGMTPNTGANYAAVDEATAPDDDTTYVAANVVGTKDTYTVGNLPASVANGTVKAVQAVITSRKDNAGDRSVAPVVRHSGADYDLTAVALTASYVMNRDIQETNPGTAAAWTVADINNMELGQKVAA